MGRITKVLGFSVPPALAEEVEQVAKAERRTKSELFREMFRVYQRYRQQREQEEERWVTELIREAQAEQEKNPLTPEELVKELTELARYGAQQAKKLGIKPKDVNRIIDESRKRWGSS
ncbi:MAG: ribbon-helix-helix protein, CopG family [Nitrospinae bacterium]|nr:ribbon-helix-helix protein, CopG family [Nitrospinota bacterium]